MAKRKKNSGRNRSVGDNITERRRVEQALGEPDEREAMIELLRLISANNHIHELMQLVMMFLRGWSGCSAVGIRLRDGEDFPYFETKGFPEEFVLAESKLCSMDEMGELVRDSKWRPFLECMCGNIISERFDPSKPFFTGHGSFWTNSTTELLASTSEADRLARMRNRCNTAGYESVALIPLRVGEETLGLLQFNDTQEGQFSPEKILLLERLADNLAISLAHRQAELELRKSEKHFRTVADFANDWEYWIGPDGNYIYVSPSCERVTGYRPEEFMKDPELLMKIVHPEDRARLVEHDKEVAGSAKPCSMDFRIITRSGQERWIGHRCQSVYSPDGPFLGKRGSNRDITERERAEEKLKRFNRTLAEKSKELESIIQIASHDLRTPLVTARGFVPELAKSCEQVQSILNKKNVPVKIKKELSSVITKDIPESLRIIQHSMDTIGFLLDALLRLARLGKTATKFEELDMGAMLRDIKQIMVRQIQAAGATLEISRLPKCVGDKVQINQVFSNLLDNAVKYLDPGRPGLIKVSGWSEPDRIVYCVEDNGIGIEAGNLKDVFDIFCRLRPDNGSGEGLGLTIVRRIMDRHDGKVWVESEVGRGSKFFMSLPVITPS